MRGVDLAYSCSQKGLVLPVLHLTMSPRAMEKLQQRRTKVANWYLDMSLLGKYWGSDRIYHHTAPINLYYACGRRLVAEEGLANCWQRHQRNVEYLWELEDLGLTHVEREFRLPTLTTVCIPEGVDGERSRSC